MTDLTNAETHFRFGENWSRYATQIEPGDIDHAKSELARLLGRTSLSGLSFLDVGSGSGIHSLAALRMGAHRVVAIDIDRDSVATTKSLLAQHAPRDNWTVLERSILDMTPVELGLFDIVYSWGVLHHTGAMKRAIEKAAGLVCDHGLLCIAIYRKTLLCRFWRMEKRIYNRAPEAIQNLVRGAYIGLYIVGLTIRDLFKRRLFRLERHLSQYSKGRGMEFYTDMHDWLGGYPYESASAAEVCAMVAPLGLFEKHVFARSGVSIGLFGSGCDEYVFQKQNA